MGFLPQGQCYNSPLMPLNLASLRQQFPILRERINGHSLVYLDNAATSQKPQRVIDAMDDYYAHSNANINRGVHVLGERATVAYEDARRSVQNFLHAAHAHEIIFTRNATEGINLAAKSWGRANVGEDDAIALSILEHHSNIVPWFQLASESGALVEWFGIDARGQIDLAALETVLHARNVKLVAVTGVSNVLGTVVPLRKIIEMAHAAGARVLVDAAQLVPHSPIDVRSLDCDFLVFSSHKLYGPTGIGVLYGKAELLEAMPPFLGGGDMISSVEKDRFTPAELPRKFEAGTPAIAEAVGLKAAIEWLSGVGSTDVAAHERSLLAQTLYELSSIEGLKILGPRGADEIMSCVSFTLEGIHPHDLTQVLSDRGVCLRAGHHCTQPLHRELGIAASTRLSVGVYNTMEEVGACAAAIREARGKLLDG